MKEIEQQYLIGERALYRAKDLIIRHTTFNDGESPLKESENIEIYQSLLKWKYPIWYAKHIKIEDCTLYEMARAGIWYTDDITIKNTLIDAPKNLRRSKNVVLENVSIPHAEETLWACDGVRMDHVHAHGDYFAMNSKNIDIDHFELIGNYSFDGCTNLNINHARLLTKDAFWNSENVTVRNSFISGEYFGWNAKNITLIDCAVESLQGMCYIDNLVMKNCRLLNTTLAFEYSSVNADIRGKIDSVLNPKSGIIKADTIGNLIIEKDKVDPTKTKIICNS